jgi:hypothetical protein
MQRECQAEIKPFKVGETVVSNVTGNPEPSTLELSKEACVETRRRVCIKCEGDIPSTKYKNAKYCSDRCRNAYVALQHAYKTGRIKNPGVGSGGSQWGEKNSQYTGKSGASGCRKAMKLLPSICNRCNSTSHLLAHHIDHNRENNSLDNFEILCKSCHQRHHETRDEQGRYTKG